MTNDGYISAAEQVFKSIEACCDTINATTDADIDNLRNGNALTLAFSNGTQIVINLQKPLKEIWLAAQVGGYHFKLNHATQTWQENREGLEFFSALSNFSSQQSGYPISFFAC